MTRFSPLLARLAPILFLVGIALVVAACIPGTNVGVGAGRLADPQPGAAPAGLARREPDRPPVLAVHADLPGAVHRARVLRPDHADLHARGQHRRRDHPADGADPGARGPALPPPARLDPADAAHPARGQGAPAQVQGRPRQAAGGHPGVLPPARDQPGRRLPADHPAVRAPDPDVLGHQPGPHELRPERDVARLRVQPVPGHRVPDRARVQLGRPRDQRRASTRSSPASSRGASRSRRPPAGTSRASASASSRSSRRCSRSSRRG